MQYRPTLESYICFWSGYDSPRIGGRQNSPTKPHSGMFGGGSL